MGAGSEVNPLASPSSSSAAASPQCGKRSRDPEDEVYVDNLHSHKRYLSELRMFLRDVFMAETSIMASSLNGLTVGDQLSAHLMDSPIRSETSMHYLRDDISVQYSPMSEDSDESRCYDCCSSSQPESAPTSPVSSSPSPYRYQKPFSGGGGGGSSTSTPPQSRQRGSDGEGRFPSSPSDICHSADLRRAALLRSVQMRTQPVGPELQGPESSSVLDVDDRSHD